MISRKRAKWLRLLLASLFASIVSGCVAIRDIHPCTIAGSLTAGGICGHTQSPETQNLTFKEMLEFLTAQPARVCVPVPGLNVCKEDQSTGTPIKLPKRGAAVALSSDEYNEMKTDGEIMCRMLGARCRYIGVDQPK